MIKGIDIRGVEKSLNLLEEYNSRVKRIYKNIIEEGNLSKINISIQISFVAILLSLISVGLKFFSSSSVNLAITLASAFIGLSVAGFFATSVFRSRRLNNASKEELWVSVKQLEDITRFVSQYYDHNDFELSSFLRFEIKLKLTESNETLKTVKNHFPYFFERRGISEENKEKKEDYYAP